MPRALGFRCSSSMRVSGEIAARRSCATPGAAVARLALLSLRPLCRPESVVIRCLGNTPESALSPAANALAAMLRIAITPKKGPVAIPSHDTRIALQGIDADHVLTVP